MARAGAQLDVIRPDGARDLASAFERDPWLAQDAAAGDSRGAARAMAEEARVRLDSEALAERFVERWQELSRSGPAKERMAGIIEGLRRDPELEGAGASCSRAVDQLDRGRPIDEALTVVIRRDGDLGLATVA